ncbi:MAG TPA: hypothetical protein VLS94_06315, partial [Fusibacter sp.]|nr:hypothetical protein [Fusibacter sp.]
MADQGNQPDPNMADPNNNGNVDPNDEDSEPPLAQATPIFSLSPGLYFNQVIDYSTPQGTKLFNKATEKLQEELFDVDADNLHGFLDALDDKSMYYGWKDILSIPLDVDEPFDDLIYLVTNYGELSMQQIYDHVITYISDEVRAAQDSYLLYMCLMKSLSKVGKNKVTLHKRDYTVHENGRMFFSGVLLLKVIIRESRVDTRSTVRHIRSKLNSLPSYLASINQDIPAFNHYVLGLLEQLNARGETTHDLLANLFTTFKSVTDRRFVNYINYREMAYDQGEDIDSLQLMHDAQTGYQ